MDDNVIALFELKLVEGDIKVVEEEQYRLVPSDQVSDIDLQTYRI